MTRSEEAHHVSRAASPRSELWRRIASALVLAPAVLVLVWLGGIAFDLLCAVAALVLLIEWNAVARGGARDVVFFLSAGALVGALPVQQLGGPAAAAGLIGAAAVAAAALEALGGRSGAWSALGLVYAGIVLVAGGLIRSEDSLGLVAVIWLLLLVWASDTGAYAAGRIVGGPKLWPSVSPKKTWAGLVGGIAAAAIIGGLVARVGGGTALVPALAVSAAFGLVAQTGDLIESAFKRKFQVKDASRLIPGHGGLMDRIDSLIAVLAIAAPVGLARGPSAAEGLLIW